MTSLYHTLTPKVLRRNLLDPQNDKQNLYFDREAVKRRRHEEYLELKRQEAADPAKAEAFKRRRLEEKAAKEEAKKRKEMEEKEGKEVEEVDGVTFTPPTKKMEKTKKTKKMEEEEEDDSSENDMSNSDDDDNDDDDDENENEDGIPVYRGLKDRQPSMLAIVSGGADGNLVVYNVESRREVNTFKLMGFPGFYNPVVSVSEHYACLMVCDDDG